MPGMQQLADHFEAMLPIGEAEELIPEDFVPLKGQTCGKVEKVIAGRTNFPRNKTGDVIGLDTTLPGQGFSYKARDN